MRTCDRSNATNRRIGAALAVALIVAALPAKAENGAQPQPPASAPATAPTIAQIVAANASNPKAIDAALRPIIVKDPKSAKEIVDIAKQSKPDVATALAQELSSIQRGMRDSDPDGAKTIAAIVAEAPASFQTDYAVALAGGDSGGQGAGSGTQNAAAAQTANESSDNGTATGSASNGTGSSGTGAGFGGFGGAGGGSAVSGAKP